MKIQRMAAAKCVLAARIDRGHASMDGVFFFIPLRLLGLWCLSGGHVVCFRLQVIAYVPITCTMIRIRGAENAGGN